MRFAAHPVSQAPRHYHHTQRSTVWKIVNKEPVGVRILPTTVLTGLAAANVGLYSCWESFEGDRLLRLFEMFATSSRHSPHTLLTATFSYLYAEDLAFNMLGLCYFGRAVCQVLGARRSLRLYLGSGALSFVAAIGDMLRRNHDGVCMGAMGAVYSVMAMNLLLDRQRVTPWLVSLVFVTVDVHKRQHRTVMLVDDPWLHQVDTLTHVTADVGGALCYLVLRKRGILVPSAIAKSQRH